MRRLGLWEKLKKLVSGEPDPQRDSLFHTGSMWGVMALANGTFEKIMPVREDFAPEEIPPDIYLDKNPGRFDTDKDNHNISITGSAGSGKSYLGFKLLKVRVEQGFYKAWVISPKACDVWNSLEGFKIFDVAKSGMPDPFAYDPKHFIKSVMLTASDITSVGMNADALENILTNLCSMRLASFDEAIKRLEKMSKISSYKFAIESLIFKMEAFSQVPIVQNFQVEKENIIWDFSGLEGDALIFYSNLLVSISLEKMIAGNERDFLLCVDEVHRLIKVKSGGDVSKYSVLNDIARMGRAFSGGLWVLSQFLSDISFGIRGNMGIQLVFNTTDFVDVGLISSDLLRYVCKNLGQREFVDIRQHYGEHFTPIYRWIGTPIPDPKNLVEIKFEEEKKLEPIEALTQPEPVSKLDRKGTEAKIVEILENECLYANEISKKLGIDNKDAKGRLLVKDIIKNLLDNQRIRVILYVSENKRIKPRKIYFVNENRAETSVHKMGVDDAKKVVEKIEPVISEYKSNQSWDLESSTACYDFKTGFQHAIKDDVVKLQNIGQFPKPTIFVCANLEVQRRYENYLSVVDGIEKRYHVCCLDILEDLLTSLRN